ncbi:HNH endonuclease [Chryseobacterium sp. 'Rf worker isolate 10']|jgi:uncharacterized protein (TIGR02646 family)|uniref:HNH endonuclease n=1 Tax=Chryseobacterium sp. 'Rf worker isolate 10' TaxID=2887348 RepID=UPI003D6E42F2
MSRIKKSKPFFFQSLEGKEFKYLKKELLTINGLCPLTGGEWEGIIKNTSKIMRKDRDEIVSKIKAKLEKIQGPYCIYCGLHEKHCGPLEREHIAPKGYKSHPQFMFEPQNLALACHHCNFDLKKEYDTINKINTNYSKCTFNIIHPYFDNINSHISFVSKEGMVLIKSKRYSRKGRNYIRLFELDSVYNTEKRSGLLIVNEVKSLNKYDSMLNDILEKKYIQK